LPGVAQRHGINSPADAAAAREWTRYFAAGSASKRARIAGKIRKISDLTECHGGTDLYPALLQGDQNR
jgi:hypothetical protein